jgi:hypothetical protein
MQISGSVLLETPNYKEMFEIYVKENYHSILAEIKQKNKPTSFDSGKKQKK